MDLKFATKGPDDTRELGVSLSGVFEFGDVVLLAGDLGAGKTCLVQGIARGLGVDEQVTSPTFTLVRSYAGRLELVHADVYRLDHLEEVTDLGLTELVDGRGVAVVEWGDVAAPALPADHLEVALALGAGDDDRVVTMRPSGPAWTARMVAVAGALSSWAVDA